MAKKRKKLNLSTDYEEKTVNTQDVKFENKEISEEKIKSLSSLFLINGAPVVALKEENGRYKLLSSVEEFVAVKSVFSEIKARIYKFSERDAEIMRLIDKAKRAENAIETAETVQELIEKYSLTQEQIGTALELSRPAITNTLKLLTLDSEVQEMIKNGKLSAGHARTLARVPKDKQLLFAKETVKKGVSVRETERAVKAYLTPPEVLAKEKENKKATDTEELKAVVEKMRKVFNTQVSLIGNAKKGRIYIDYYTNEDLKRFSEILENCDKE